MTERMPDAEASIAFAAALIAELVAQENAARGIVPSPAQASALACDAKNVARYLYDHGALAP